MNTCPFCFNAYVYSKQPQDDLFDEGLNDTNDSSSATIGRSGDCVCMYLNTGNGEATNIEVCQWVTDIDATPHSGRWHTVAKYYPKYCPECGRKLEEYQVGERGSTYTKQ